MNPQGGEGGNNQSPATPTAPIAESNVGVSSNPLGELEGAVAAAREEAAVQPTAPVQPPAETPEGQFATQFGGVVPPVESTPTTSPPAESAPDLMSEALANLGATPPAVDASVPQPSTDNLAPEQTQPVVETLAQPEPEQAPAEKLKQQISDSVNAFLEEVLKKEGVPS